MPETKVKLQAEIEQLRYALDNVPSYVYIKDIDSRYVYANRLTLDLFGCTIDELVGAEDSKFFPPDTVQKLREIDLSVLAGNNSEEEVVIDYPEIGRRVYHEVKTPIYSNQNSQVIIGILGISTDISKQKKVEAHAVKLANTDQLTQVANRFRLEAVLSDEIKRQARYDRAFTLVLVDVDHFKKVNDSYGHLIGDLCLQKMCQVIEENIRETDFLGRWGGEEFMILCPETNVAGCHALTEKIRKAIEDTPIDQVGHITASFGLAEFQQGDTEITLIQRADKALYEAKHKGRNCVAG